MKPGNWVDGDALPNGWLGPHPPVGQPRHTRLTEDEERSEFALWAFARAPLIEGANLIRLDEPTRALMTNRELLSLDQHATESHPVTNLSFDPAQVRVWEAQKSHPGKPRHYFAFFNLQDQRLTLRVVWSGLGVAGDVHSIRDIWDEHDLAPAESITVRLPPHGCALYQVQ